MLLCRALRTSVGSAYGKVSPGELVEMPEHLAQELIRDGQFELVYIHPKATYISKVEDYATKVVVPSFERQAPLEEVKKASKDLKKGRPKK